MEKYNPLEAPPREEWLELDEATRIDLVRDYHDATDDELEDDRQQLHAVIHAVVENQIALSVEPVPGTIARLRRQGLNRHEALHAVGSVLAQGLVSAMQGGGDEFHPRQYRRRLVKLTAKRWKKGLKSGG